ncbi:hypothetical protein ACFRKB_11285 [Streptomyces scopuliridis]|uniref:hypothetical protein n=1 Tax=Streptomyces scopuliridis TaxID=452529 RepID=UPI0036AB9604
MTTPADELRAAAHKLRAFATTATPGPWTQTGIGDYGWTVSSPTAGLVDTEDSDQGRADADYIAAMDPALGLPLADWLDSAAEDAEQVGPDRHALAVARQINGTQ